MSNKNEGVATLLVDMIEDLIREKVRDVAQDAARKEVERLFRSKVDQALREREEMGREIPVRHLSADAAAMHTRFTSWRPSLTEVGDNVFERVLQYAQWLESWVNNRMRLKEVATGSDDFRGNPALTEFLELGRARQRGTGV